MTNRGADQQQAVKIDQFRQLEQQDQQPHTGGHEKHRLKDLASPGWTTALTEYCALG
jgi:hypothetical protein